MTERVLVVGAGFAGLWAALAAVRRLEELGIGSGRAGVTLINRDGWHAIRVRNYETDIANARVPLAGLVEPAGVELVLGTTTAIDPAARRLTIERDGRLSTLGYDRLVLAAGSRLSRPDIPGLATHAFSIDTWDEAAALQRHVSALARRPPSASRDTVLIAGGGLTGIELACEMPERLRAAGILEPRVLLCDRQPAVGWDMGEDARAEIADVLARLGVESRGGIEIARIDETGATLAGGERLAAETVVWTAGLRASPLAALLPVPLDPLGRIHVDRFMRVVGLEAVFAAGDIAAAPLPGEHATVMSCQFARPMGRFAGHNAVSDLLGQELLPMDIDRYVTCLDLGPAGALLTQGWERRVAVTGADAKRIKTEINRERIYPPRTGLRRDLLDAAAPIVQTPPKPA